MDLESTRNEWDNVPTITPSFHIGGNNRRELLNIPQSRRISAEEALNYLRNQELSYFMSSIEPFVLRRGISRFFVNLMGPPKLLTTLESERNEIFAIAQCQLDSNNEVHNRMLQTVYKGLTGLHLGCPRFGSHWEQVGFQGNDPGTDLRGVGLMGLVHLVHLASNPRLAPLARAVYCASLDPHTGFPLAVLSLNLTKSTLQALREGILNRECNEQKTVTSVVLQFYAALFSHTLRLWQSKHCTLNESGYVIKRAESQCRRKVRTSLENLQDHLRNLSAPERCSPRARFVQAGSLHQLASQAKSEFFI